MARIQKEAVCPKCKAGFKMNDIDIINLDKDVVNFGINCSNCQAQAVISGQVHVEKIPMINSGLMASKSQKKPQIQVENIAKTLKNFKENDIVKLFEKDQNMDK